MNRDIFQAVADPTRREILHILSKKTMNLNAVADNFSISRPAISKHIKVLTEAGLIIIDKQGREHICTANLKPLKELADWAKQYKDLWQLKTDILEDIKEELFVKDKKKGKKKKKDKKKHK